VTRKSGETFEEPLLVGGGTAQSLVEFLPIAQDPNR
jgi:hypothetical protein